MEAPDRQGGQGIFPRLVDHRHGVLFFPTHAAADPGSGLRRGQSRPTGSTTRSSQRARPTDRDERSAHVGPGHQHRCASCHEHDWSGSDQHHGAGGDRHHRTGGDKYVSSGRYEHGASSYGESNPSDEHQRRDHSNSRDRGGYTDKSSKRNSGRHGGGDSDSGRNGCCGDICDSSTGNYRDRCDHRHTNQRGGWNANRDGDEHGAANGLGDCASYGAAYRDGGVDAESNQRSDGKSNTDSESVASTQSVANDNGDRDGDSHRDSYRDPHA